MAVMGYDDWLSAQNCLLGAALLNPELVPQLVSDLRKEDFTGSCATVFAAMSELFLESKTGLDIDPVAICHKLGDTQAARQLLAELMQMSPYETDIGRYIQTAKDCHKLSRLRELGSSLMSAETLDSAQAATDSLTNLLMHSDTFRAMGPEELIASYEARHQSHQPRLTWPIQEMTDAIPARPGNMIAILAEPSGGKTAFALQCMWEWSKHLNVLFVSLETDADTLFDTWSAFIAGIDMDDVMGGIYSDPDWYRWKSAKEQIRQRKFRILPGASMGVDQIKAAALKYKADIVIIDYLQLVPMSGKLSRYEAVTEISMRLHTMAQTTGIIVVPLCQVTVRDPKSRNAPLSMHSTRESGQIEQDCDVMIAIDLYVDKELKDEGIRANRVIRCVKNKRGRKFRMPAVFDGRLQTFRKSNIPNKNWEAAQNKRTQEQDEMHQLSMDVPVPF